jgi:putative flippase GtrA
VSGVLARQFARFCVVGGIGFVVDAGLLWLLLQTTALGPYGGRAISFLAAATVTWSLHRRFTFPGAPRDRRARQWLHFVAVNGAGALLNYGIYALLVATTAFLAQAPVLAVAVGAAVAMVVNFAANRLWVFRHARP